MKKVKLPALITIISLYLLSTTNEKKYYNSFDLWNEFRFGYQYDFKVSSLPVFVKAQIPFGFALYAQNKPKSFLEMEEKGDNRFFYKAVLVYFGIRF